ncbi:MAG: cytoplasmic protein [Acidobacteria bacterium]|nr:cytoplasmic protein [Acidobacteriota bacterium]
MKPTEVLITEHNAVLLGLEILEKVEAALEAGSADAPQHLGQLIDFFRGFVDRCHHGKEEDILFPELEKRGLLREGGPIGVMLAEHEIGRQRIQGMSSALDRLRQGESLAVSDIRENSLGYRNLLKVHIHKENNILFPMADSLLNDDDAVKIIDRFAEIEKDRVGPGKHEAYHSLLHRLKEIYRV